ncbi:MAG: glycosyltransferase family 2 protein [Candidatus Neomarinimicrobiota bacterium]
MSSSSNVRVSVIIVTYNSEEEIGPCIRSVVPQVSSVGGEIIVVDNASADRTVERIESLRNQNKNIQIITNTENVGFSRANNQAFEMARGESILLLNPDTELRAETIEKLSFLLSTNDELGAVAPQLRLPDGRIQTSCRRFPTYGSVLFEMFGLSKTFPRSRFFNGWKMGDFDHTSSREVDQPAAAALMIRTELLRSLKGFDPAFPMFFSDVDLCRRIWKTRKILFYPGAVVMHHGGASINPRKPSMIVNSHRSFIRYFRKWHAGPANRVMNIVIAVALYIAMGFRVVWTVVFRKRKAFRRTAL